MARLWRLFVVTGNAHFQAQVSRHQLWTVRETKYLEERYKADWPVRLLIFT